jgi:osmotically-inducible protein OsmY
MMITREANTDQLTRPDDSLQSDIWATILREETICSLDLDNLSITVQDGEAFLRGHLAREYNRQIIEDIAHYVPGVTKVHNDLVVDRVLTIQVAQALFRDDRTRPLILPVESFHGWISLGGEVPTRELQAAAEEVAGQVPSVRGVPSLPAVVGESRSPARRAVQPQIGAGVYESRGLAGIVTQVVIQPRNRLVSHVVVRANDVAVLANDVIDDRPAAGEFVVPVEAIDLVRKNCVFLVRDGPSLSAYPAFDPSDYSLAPSTWQPPYPYTTDAVRWSCSSD